MPVQIDMDMPKDCKHCRFCEESTRYRGTTYIKCFLAKLCALPKGVCKNPDCPLKEVKE